MRNHSMPRGLLYLILILSLIPTAARADLDDPGTIILGGGGGYGSITGASRYGSEFGGGGNYFFTGKFMVSRNMAIGVYFQNQSYGEEALLPSLPTFGEVTEAVLVTYEAHAIYYFNRLADASRYIDVGIGLYRPELRSSDVGTGFPDSGFTFSAALGAEVFIRPQTALDFALRGVGYVGEGYVQPEIDVFTGPSPDDPEALEQWEEDKALFEDTGNLSFALQGQVAILFYLFD